MAIDESRLGGGVTEDIVLDAIRSSGYPLQAKAVEIAIPALAGSGRNVRLFEEWSFIDSDTGTVRQLDALIQRSFDDIYDPKLRHGPLATDPRALLRYELDFLIECKQTELPFVFFVRDHLYLPNVPTFVGLPNNGTFSVGQEGDEDGLFIDMRLQDFLPATISPPTAISVSRCYRKGRRLELSGEDVFRSLTAPIKKAFQHYKSTSEQGLHNRLYHDIRMVHAVVVLDAPMLACHTKNGEITLEEIPAVRLPLTEPSTSAWHPTGMDGISLDFVHINHLEKYAGEAARTARTIAETINSIALQVVASKAFVDFASLPKSEEDFLGVLAPPIVGEEEVARWIKKRSVEVHARLAEEGAKVLEH